MSLFVVTYTHPNEEGWNEHVGAHVQYLLDLLKSGTLVASGPCPGRPVKSAMLILRAADRSEIDEIIAADPFDAHGLIAEVTVTAWDPIFGAFNGESTMPDASFRAPAQARREHS